MTSANPLERKPKRKRPLLQFPVAQKIQPLTSQEPTSMTSSLTTANTVHQVEKL